MRIVDIHCHFYPKEYLALLQRILANDSTPWARSVQAVQTALVLREPRMTDISAHLDDMDRFGVDVQVLSLSIPHAYFDSEAESVEAARIVNDALAELCARYPTRFKGLALLPLPHVEASMKELERAATSLGLHGIAFGGNVKGIPVDDERFLPVYRELNRLKLPIHFHPMIPPGDEELADFGISPSIGYLMDTAAAALRLVHRGILEENRDLKVIMPHLGTYLLSAWDRIQNNPRKDSSPLITRPLGFYLKELYYDSVNLHRPMWDCALQTIDVSHVVYGTDYPFVPGNTERGIELINGLDITEQAREGIFHTNVEQLLR
jgi:aminocarboxymuconate-semialdehyde decarboxylase